MKKLFSLFVALLATSTLWAHDFEVDGIYYNWYFDGGDYLEVTYCGSKSDSYSNEYSGSVEIPAIIYDDYGTAYNVIRIHAWAFSDCSSLTSITIPNSVTSIGDHAFDGCSSLTYVTIPNSVTSIANRCFQDCSSLTSITIPNSVTSIGASAFSGCSSLTSMVVESGNTVYDSRENSNAIIETASNALIRGCQNTTIPNSVTSIGASAFSGCSSLTSITIPNSVTSIGDYVFASCPSLSSITIPNSVTSIGDYAFWSCINLSSVAIPNSVTSIGVQAFRYCFYLTDLTIGSGVTSIGEEAFIECRHLEKINVHSIIPPNVSGNTFDYYDAELYVPCDSKQAYEAHPIFGKFKNIKCLDEGNGGFVTTHIHDTICQGEVYEFGEYLCDTTGTYTSIIGGVTTFLYLTVLPQSTDTIIIEVNDSYTWHDEVYTESGEYKFVTVAANGCDSIEVLYLTIIPSDNPDITGEQQIYYTSSDGNIVNPTNPNGFGANIISNTYENGQGVIEFDASITSIGDTAFATCSTLTNITIPNTVKHIGVDAFLDCSSINSIIIPDKVESIDSYAFEWCSSLESIIIPNSVTYIGYGIFAGCDSLTSVMVDNQNPVYDSRNNCNAIIETATNTLIAGCKNTVIPNTIISIGRCAFVSCHFLPSVTIPQGVKSIGNHAFSACSRIPSINIPKSVTQIGYQAFATGGELAEIIVETGNPIYDSRENCNAIIETATNTLIAGCKNTTIPNTVEHIGGAAFYGCQHMANPLVIPEGVKTIGEGAFMFCLSLPSISIPNSVTWIDGYAFYQCSSLTSITIPENVTNIGAYAFYLCNALKSVTWNAKNCADFEPYEAIVPFYLIRSQITSFTFGDKVEHIPAYLCYNMDNLSSITIPEHVTSIGEGALAYCAFDTINCLPTTPPTVNTTFASSNFVSLLQVPCESLEAYKAHEVWGRFNTIQCLEDLIPDPTERVLSCEEAVALCLETGTTATTEEYTIRGYVTDITTEYSEQYNNISFYMADAKDGGHVLYTYRVKPKFEADVAVKVGDFVEVVGKLVNYNGFLPEVYPGIYTIVNEPGFPTGTSDTQLQTSNTKKLVKDGQLLIIHNGKIYTIMGTEVK